MKCCKLNSQAPFHDSFAENERYLCYGLLYVIWVFSCDLKWSWNELEIAINWRVIQSQWTSRIELITGQPVEVTRNQRLKEWTCRRLEMGRKQENSTKQNCNATLKHRLIAPKELSKNNSQHAHDKCSNGFFTVRPNILQCAIPIQFTPILIRQKYFLFKFLSFDLLPIGFVYVNIND